jgi:hypothetical protein
MSLNQRDTYNYEWLVNQSGGAEPKSPKKSSTGDDEDIKANQPVIINNNIPDLPKLDGECVNHIDCDNLNDTDSMKEACKNYQCACINRMCKPYKVDGTHLSFTIIIPLVLISICLSIALALKMIQKHKA